MKHNILIFGILLLGMTFTAKSQEMNFTVKINTLKLQTVDPAVFVTLETTLFEFLNNQKWTSDIFETEERINCNLIMTIQEERSPTSFKADLAIQSSRPVYGAEYSTPILNHIDKDVVFEYEQYQPIQFSRNSYNDNLSSILSYYVYVILGMDYDTFSPFGGEEYFRTAQEILNSVPSSVTSAVPGWRSVENNRNRFWLVENLLSPRIRPLRQSMYDYHRQGLDIMYQDVNTGRAIMTQAIQELGKVNQSYPNAMIIQLFNNAKSSEIVEVFKRGTREEQSQVLATMKRIDSANASKYNEIR